MLEVISVLEVISIIQLHILVCLPNIYDNHFDKMATFYNKNEFYFAAAAVRGKYRGVLGFWNPL